MPAEVERVIHRVMSSSGVDKGRAIAILKSRGVIKQKGKHLARSRKAKRKHRKRAK